MGRFGAGIGVQDTVVEIRVLNANQRFCYVVLLSKGFLWWRFVDGAMEHLDMSLSEKKKNQGLYQIWFSI